jgi:hypothetical protein
MEEGTRIKNITISFHQNIQTLVTFAETIGSFADEHDRRVRGSINKLLVDLASAFDQILSDSSSEVESNSEGDCNNQKERKKLSEEQKQQFIEKLKTVAFDNRNQIKSLNKTVKKTLPVQGNILRRSALISLMATFETLISQLIREFYYKYPEALPSESKSLSLADLRDLGSVEEAEKFLIDNEIDSVLRGNIQSQLACFEKPIKVSLKPIEKYFDQIIELSQRRNLLVHNDGRVNRHYLNKAPKSFLNSDIKEGDKIKVS